MITPIFIPSSGGGGKTPPLTMLGKILLGVAWVSFILLLVLISFEAMRSAFGMGGWPFNDGKFDPIGFGFAVVISACTLVLAALPWMFKD